MWNNSFDALAPQSVSEERIEEMLCLHQANLEETMEKWFLAEHMETNFVDEEHIGHAYAIEATSHRPTISATSNSSSCTYLLT